MDAESATQRFGPGGRFELQAIERRLLVDGQPARLGARAFDLLLALAARPGALLTKNDLIETVWPGVVVEEGNLTTQISTLRKVLGSDIIATIPGRGYRFTAHVEAAAPEAATAQAAPDRASEFIAAGGNTAAAPPPPRPALRTNLPAELPPLIGRDDDLAALSDLIAQQRLVSIVGAGGMGKTRLAQALLLGHRNDYPHGVCWVDLSSVNDPAAIASSVATALGLSSSQGEPLAGLCAQVAQLTMLLALDNAEHLLEGTAGVVQALLDAAPGLRVLVTSQAPLKLPRECVYRVDALRVPDGLLPAAEALAFGAVALFATRARQADARFTLTDANAPAVITLCRELDGLALAIEMAAARAPMLGVQQLAASMPDRLKLLTDGRNRIAPARQRTLRATLEWSHGFLDETERTVFRRLAVFAGSGSLAMVRRVVADEALDEWAVLDALALLVDRSLVVALTPDDGTEPRYRLLDTPRLFALERLRKAGEEEALRRRHALAFAERFDVAWDEPWAGEVSFQAWREAMFADMDNGWQAYEWACAADDRLSALRCAVTLLAVLRRSNPRALLALCDRCEPWLEDLADDDLRARLARGIATIVDFTSVPRAESVLRAALARTAPATSAKPHQRWLRYVLLTQHGLSLSRLARREEATQALREAAECESAEWPVHRRYLLPESASLLAAYAGDMPEAIRQIQQASLMVQATGGPTGTFEANLLNFQLAAGDAAAAVKTGQALVHTLSGGRDPYSLGHIYTALGAAWLMLGDTAQARAALRDGWPLAQVFKVSYSESFALLAALESRPRAAARLAGFADKESAGLGEVREPNEAAAIQRATQLARAALGEPEFERLHAQGAALREADIEAIAFATDDAA